MTELTASVQAIKEKSAKLDPLETALTLAAAIFIAIGWVVGKFFVVLWAVVAFLWTASEYGFRVAIKKEGG